MTDESLHDAIRAEALRLNDRYLKEVIERFSFCPYARMARRTQKMKRYVWFGPLLPTTPLLELMASIAADPSQEVVQIIFPDLEVEPWPWRMFVKRLDTEIADHSALRRFKSVLASAAFHPDADYSPATPARLVPLFRRAPDPTIQWTRLDVLEAISSSVGHTPHYIDLNGKDLDEIMATLSTQQPPLSERIAKTNHEVARSMGVEAVEAMLAEIAEDRRCTYARLLGEGRSRPTLDVE